MGPPLRAPRRCRLAREQALHELLGDSEAADDLALEFFAHGAARELAKDGPKLVEDPVAAFRRGALSVLEGALDPKTHERHRGRSEKPPNGIGAVALEDVGRVAARR
jgi:hypothetical protein